MARDPGKWHTEDGTANLVDPKAISAQGAAREALVRAWFGGLSTLTIVLSCAGGLIYLQKADLLVGLAGVAIGHILDRSKLGRWR